MHANATVIRLTITTAAGLVVGLATGVMGRPLWAPMVGWVAAALTFCAWTWLRLGRLDAATTRSHATREDAGRTLSDVVLALASLAAVVGMGFLLVASSDKGEKNIEALIGALGVVAAWFVVHTMFALHYARLYFGTPEGGIDFGGEEGPTYADFAYLSFTIGMTYQVSDTTLTLGRIRHAALRQGLLSYLLGAVILACTINLVVQLASGGG